MLWIFSQSFFSISFCSSLFVGQLVSNVEILLVAKTISGKSEKYKNKCEKKEIKAPNETERTRELKTKTATKRTKMQNRDFTFHILFTPARWIFVSFCLLFFLYKNESVAFGVVICVDAIAVTDATLSEYENKLVFVYISTAVSLLHLFLFRLLSLLLISVFQARRKLFGILIGSTSVQSFRSSRLKWFAGNHLKSWNISKLTIYSHICCERDDQNERRKKKVFFVCVKFRSFRLLFLLFSLTFLSLSHITNSHSMCSVLLRLIFSQFLPLYSYRVQHSSDTRFSVSFAVVHFVSFLVDFLFPHFFHHFLLWIRAWCARDSVKSSSKWTYIVLDGISISTLSLRRLPLLLFRLSLIAQNALAEQPNQVYILLEKCNIILNF